MRRCISHRFVVLVVLLLAVLTPSIIAQSSLEVDREELESQIDRSVEFQNYTGPYEEIDSAEEIISIGRSLATRVPGTGTSGRIGNSYRIVRASDPAVVEGYDADILYILEEGRVDHIDNVRRILAGYLEAAYDYRRSDALLLAELVTIYNAIYRGNLDFYRERYKSVVLRNLSEGNVGISTLYSDWPGATELVTPLFAGAEPGRLRSIDPVELADEAVEEQLRQEEDRSIDTREDIVDLMERSIDQEEERLADEERSIEEEREQLEQERQELEDQQEELERERATTTDRDRQRELDEQERSMAESFQRLQQEEQALQQREQAAAEGREDVEELTEVVREQRESIAEDRRDLLDAGGGVAESGQVLFLRSSEAGATVLGQLVYVDSESGVVETESPVATVTSRAYERIAGDLLLVGETEGVSRLLLFSPSDLTVRLAGTDEVFPQSNLLVVDGGREVYAVVRIDGGYYVGRFDDGLTLRERSSTEVSPYSYIDVAAERLWVQGDDGAIIGLDLETLSKLP